MRLRKRRTTRRGKVRLSRIPKTPDVRRYPRAEIEWGVTLETPGRRPQKGKLSGLNPFGAKLRLRSKRSVLPEGATVQLRFAPSGGEPPMTIKGLVWRTDSDGQAIVFVNLTTDDFLRLKRFVRAPASTPA